MGVTGIDLEGRSKISFKYLIVSAYSPFKYSDEYLFNMAGMHDGENFIQPVRCDKCNGYIYVMFDAYGLPEVGQCVVCGKMVKLYYKLDDWEGDWIEGGL